MRGFYQFRLGNKARKLLDWLRFPEHSKDTQHAGSEPRAINRGQTIMRSSANLMTLQSGGYALDCT